MGISRAAVVLKRKKNFNFIKKSKFAAESELKALLEGR